MHQNKKHTDDTGGADSSLCSSASLHTDCVEGASEWVRCKTLLMGHWALPDFCTLCRAVLSTAEGRSRAKMFDDRWGVMIFPHVFFVKHADFFILCSTFAYVRPTFVVSMVIR